ncbi:ferredoxin--NADP reductase [Zwartia vadi]|uniref:ferredoxin--NADP reductase n=1 Tax=Zwartia vadi TaxID=3058168 RepID=UPI0025B5AAED|nr:ferredoxin--NADP reductase [Zwartia vadi]MDN3987086.1 ferredoxin--NADP reductase [Zwartia vadi]
MSDQPTQPSLPRYTRQTVLGKTQWLTDKLFSVTVTRDPEFSFIPGQFARLGLCVGDDNTGTAADLVPNEWRAYSMVSKPDADLLEFFSVVVPEGKFSPALARLEAGDPLWIDKSVFGFLTLERFVDGEDLWLVATGTGLSAYLSMLRDPATWKRFKRIILLHGVRHANELAYRQELLSLASLHNSQRTQFIYLPVTSQEPLTCDLSPSVQPQWLSPARLTTLLNSGELEQRAGVDLDPARARIMLCGNPAMVTDMRGLLSARGFAPGRRGVAGNLAVENYW